MWPLNHYPNCLSSLEGQRWQGVEFQVVIHYRFWEIHEKLQTVSSAILDFYGARSPNPWSQLFVIFRMLKRAKGANLTFDSLWILKNVWKMVKHWMYYSQTKEIKKSLIWAQSFFIIFYDPNHFSSLDCKETN